MPRRVKACQKAISSVVERLEERCLLTTIVGGGEDPVTGQPLTTTVTYNSNPDLLAASIQTALENLFGFNDPHNPNSATYFSGKNLTVRRGVRAA